MERHRLGYEEDGDGIGTRVYFGSTGHILSYFVVLAARLAHLGSTRSGVSMIGAFDVCDAQMPLIAQFHTFIIFSLYILYLAFKLKLGMKCLRCWLLCSICTWSLDHCCYCSEGFELASSLYQ